MSINTCTLSGNLGKDAELRVNASLVPVVNFTVAVNDRKKQADGSWTNDAQWIDCVLFGKRAESLHPYLTKGTKVSVAGKLHRYTWETNGYHHSKVEVIVSDIDIMDAREGGSSQQAETCTSSYDEDIVF